MSSDSNEDSQNTITAYKRRITALEEEIQGLRNPSKPQPRGDKYLAAGRAIRRLVTLTDRIEDLVGEADRRACMSVDEFSCTEHSDEEIRLYDSYKALMKHLPGLRRDLAAKADSDDLNFVFKHLNKGADGARGDDAAGLKASVISWVMSFHPTSQSVVEPHEADPRDKAGRGFYHTATGRLICPVDYDWSDSKHRAGIRNYLPDFRVTADSWPCMLYKDEMYDPEHPTKGIFKNGLLVKAFKYIFTSPSSADSGVAIEDDELNSEPTPGPAQKRRKGPNERRTHSNLRFALSSCNSWCTQDEDFDYDQFYNNMVSYFEGVQSDAEKDEISNLLLWWNRSVFGRTNVSDYRPQATEKMSVAATLRKRRHGHGTAS
ncbi:hypothetical protein BU15DRAFT_55730 [Melanogaster broomeanus]|nr:hypothetical protein BU15DRAFT_55730 [Melanogaster broomeanus]